MKQSYKRSSLFYYKPIAQGKAVCFRDRFKSGMRRASPDYLRRNAFLCGEVRRKSRIHLFFALFIVAGLFFIAWGVSFNRRSVNASLKQPVAKVPRNYAFSEEYILRRLSCGGVDSEERYEYSLMEKYFELNDAIYIKLNVNDRQAFIVLHNDSYSEGSAEELKALLESRGIHK